MRSIEQIIESQLERWAVERRAQAESAKRPLVASEPPPHRPWIAISRDYGSGGTAIAERLSARLGYELFDRLLLDVLARETRYRRDFLASVDESDRSMIEAHVDGLLHGESFVRSDFLRHLMKVIVTIGEHGHAILVGRGAALILPPERGLTVRIVAPFEMRVEAVAARLSIPPSEARLKVQNVDRTRTSFLKTHFHRGPWTGEDHDLTINTARLSLDQAIPLVESAFFARFPKESTRVATAGSRTVHLGSVAT